MKHSYWGEEYEVVFRDLPDHEGNKERNFNLKDKNGKGWSFTVRYKMKNGFPEIMPDNHSGLPQTERDGILYKSLGI